MRMLKLLHTSDWHIGKTLYSRSRLDEFAALLDWLAGFIASERIDIVLVAGDIFDNASPGIRAQELYYAFLHRVMQSGCNHVVVTAGNHDSPAFLSAPEMLLRPLGVHVRGLGRAPEDDALLLRDAAGNPMAVVCAVPYLRDRDIRLARAEESPEDKERALVQGIRSHYEAVSARAERLRAEAGGSVPVIAMGHLFAAGGQTTDGDGVRDLYVGTLGHVPASVFPESFDYVALGHLHIAQQAGGSGRIRYCGSPLPLSFDEAGREKSVCVLECEGRDLRVRLAPVPSFRTLVSVRGGLEDIEKTIRELAEKGEPAWLEVRYEGERVIPELRERIEDLTRGSALEVLCVRNRVFLEGSLVREDTDEVLADLSREEVFLRRLDAWDVPGEQRPELLRMYGEILNELDREGAPRQGESA